MTAPSPAAAPLDIGGIRIEPGQRRTVDLFVARLYTHTEMAMPVEVVHADRAGPTVFLSATLHGDEINGLEIIRRVLADLDPYRLCGTLLAVPVVNVFGFIFQSRYLPDRRDLNRCFPGSSGGSQASRLARVFWNEIVTRCDYGIDLHTAAPPRTNLPHVRADLGDSATRQLAEAFGAPLMMGTAGPEGSLRREASRRGIRTLVYEAGEPQRFNARSIDVGVRGVYRALYAMGSIDACAYPPEPTVEVKRSRWVRARQSGIFRLSVHRGEVVEKGGVLGVIADPFGQSAVSVTAPGTGIVIGQNISPLVHRGDALVHLAHLEPGSEIPARIGTGDENPWRDDDRVTRGDEPYAP